MAVTVEMIKMITMTIDDEEDRDSSGEPIMMSKIRMMIMVEIVRLLIITPIKTATITLVVMIQWTTPTTTPLIAKTVIT